MIVLTGDLHHNTLRTGNQKHCNLTEIQVAARYLQLLERAQVKVTFFVSGRSFAEEWRDLETICRSDWVELGGHNYYCFQPSLPHRIWNKVGRSYNGPAWYQHWETQRTIGIIERKTGCRIDSWRNHMYMHGPHTESVLARCGVTVCSDGVQRDSSGPAPHATGVFNYPLNVMPDHEHLFHAERTPEYVDWFVRRYNWSDDYGSASYPIEEWTERVLDELKRHEAEGVASNMLIHPITMYLCDQFRCFERILDYLSTRETVFMSEAVRRCRHGDKAPRPIEGPAHSSSPSLAGASSLSVGENQHV